MLEVIWCPEGSAELDGCDQTVRAVVSPALSTFRHLSGHKCVCVCRVDGLYSLELANRLIDVANLNIKICISVECVVKKMHKEMF